MSFLLFNEFFNERWIFIKLILDEYIAKRFYFCDRDGIKISYM